MRVTAALAWFDEPLDLLERCVRSLAVLADKLVAVDGGYSRWPGAEAASPGEQAALIRRVARDTGLEVEVVTPKRVWAGQCEKRSFLLNKAARRSDWIAVVDADHLWHGVREATRWELEELDEDVAAVRVQFYTTINRGRPLHEAAAHEWHAGMAGEQVEIPLVFRAWSDWRVERHHWWYSAVDPDGVRRWLWAGDGSHPRAKAHTLVAPFLVEHRCLFRQDKQIVANRVFCLDRDLVVAETGGEDPVLVAA